MVVSIQRCERWKAMEKICKNCLAFKPSVFYFFRKTGYCGLDGVFVGGDDHCDFNGGDFGGTYFFRPMLVKQSG